MENATIAATTAIVESLITPNSKTINEVFQRKERYYIDIYQRDYKWQKSQIETLLKDVELRFSLTTRKPLEPKLIKQDVLKHFKPYFLNTFLTCKTSTYISIVDGQQRLTTFLIILIKLLQVVKKVHADDLYPVKTISENVLEKLIFEADDFDNPEFYKIYNPNRQGAFDAILNGEDFKPADETQKRILENYDTISKYFNAFFTTDDGTGFLNVSKLTYYIYYLLEKLNIVEVKIEHQENVATIFEVVNDRGLGLKPYEILKGKLIGNLTEEQKEQANTVWVRLQNAYYNAEISNSTESKVDLDWFFRTYLRSKFANSEAEYEKFEGKYHYELYSNNRLLEFFARFENNEVLFNWVIKDFQYYADLYLELRTSYADEYLIYNKLLDQNQQYLLLMSSISLNDPFKKEKISFVAKKFDQLHTTLRLLDVYDSSTFGFFVHKLNPAIRNQNIEEVDKAFNSILIDYLEKEQEIGIGEYKTIGDLYKWELFQHIHNRWTNFSKYVLLRIERFLSERLDKPSYCSETLRQLEDRFNKNNLRRYGMHLEHIYAYNDRNKQHFTNEAGIFDDASFSATRNKLGMVLLLKDKQNISSNNDYYNLKVEDYATSNIIWNELLVGHIDSVDRKKLPSNIQFTAIKPDENGVFPLDKVETRQKEVFEIVKLIWGF